MQTVPVIDIAPFLDGTDPEGVASLVREADLDADRIVLEDQRRIVRHVRVARRPRDNVCSKPDGRIYRLSRGGCRR